MKTTLLDSFRVPTFGAAMDCVLDLCSPEQGKDFVLEAGWTDDSTPCHRYYHYTDIGSLEYVIYLDDSGRYVIDFYVNESEEV